MTTGLCAPEGLVRMERGEVDVNYLTLGTPEFQYNGCKGLNVYERRRRGRSKQKFMV
jgi:hypothetical protein